METTLVILKPDAFARHLFGELTSIFERKGLTLVACKLAAPAKAVLEDHYSHLSHLAVFHDILDYMTSGPILIQCWQGDGCIDTVRRLVGDTNGLTAQPGTIRGQYSMSKRFNLVHASDSVEAARLEIARFFEPNEILDITHPSSPFLYADPNS